MDVPSPVDRAMPTALAPPGDISPEPPVEARPGAPGDDIGARLAQVERQMAEIGVRLDELAQTVPDTLRVVVAEQVDEVSADLRHSVSDLGRLLLRDLGRLTQILAEHREQIVADLQKAGITGAAPAAVTPRASEEAAVEEPADTTA